MPKSHQQKEATIEILTNNFTKAKSSVMVNFDGLNVVDTQEFRRACRAAGLDYVVAKKTLLKIALEKNKFSEVDLTPFQKGIGTVFGYEDEISPARVVHEFAKNHKAMSILFGLMVDQEKDVTCLDVGMIESLAKLPTKDQLLGQLVGSIKAPITGFVNVLSGNLRGLVQVLNAIKEQR